MDYTVHGILLARILEWVAIPFSRGSSQPRDQTGNICWITEKAREFQKNIHFCFTDYAKAFDCVDHNKLWKILKEMGIPEYLTYLLRNLYVGQEATARTLYGTTAWFRIEKRVQQGCLLSPCLFNSYTKHIVGNARLDELKAGIRLPGEISITSDMQVDMQMSDMQMTPPNGRKQRGTKEPSEEGERRE